MTHPMTATPSRASLDELDALLAAATPGEPCPQAWHGGLATGLLRECRFLAGHRGWHRDESGGLSWGGKLTDAEHETASRLRAVLDEALGDSGE